MVSRWQGSLPNPWGASNNNPWGTRVAPGCTMGPSAWPVWLAFALLLALSNAQTTSITPSLASTDGGEDSLESQLHLIDHFRYDHHGYWVRIYWRSGLSHLD